MKNINEDIVKLLYDIRKGNYIKDLCFEYETERMVGFKRISDNKYCSIPRGFIQEGWRKDDKVPQNIYIKSYLTFLKIYWKKREDIG